MSGVTDLDSQNVQLILEISCKGKEHNFSGIESFLKLKSCLLRIDCAQ
jgi:hypothetical protein